MDGVTGDLQMKYQKVASEYSKVRAQVSVLKKAVLDEQTKNSDLRDMLKEREQSLRKAEQEMDSLSFRNQQLTRRVTVLQEELETMSKSKKGKSKAQNETVSSVREVMGEELHKTITENARLISLLQDKEESHKQDLEVHCQRIEYLEHELRQQQDQFKKALAKIENDKAATAVNSAGPMFSTTANQKADHRTESLQKLNMELTAHARELNSQRLHLSSQLEDATRIIRTHLPFVDSNDKELNELNVPHHDRSHQADILHTVTLAAVHVDDIANAMESFHTHIRQRIIAVHGSLSPLNLKFSEHLKDGSRHAHQLKQGYLDFQQGLTCENWSNGSAPSLLCFSRSLRTYSIFLEKLHPYFSLSIEEECVVYDASEELQLANHDVVSCSSYFYVQISKIYGYVGLLAGQNRKYSQYSSLSRQRFVKELTGALKSLHHASQNLLSAYTKKLALEKESRSLNERTAEESDGIITSLSSIVTSSGKLADILDSYTKSVSKVTKHNSLAHPSVIEFHKRATNYMASLEQDEPPTISYEEALYVRGELRNGEESRKALLSQLMVLQDQVALAEREREHWQQEYQFLLVRHDSNEVNNPTGPGNSVAVGSTEGEGGKTSVTNLLGRMTSPFTLSQEIEARNEKLKQYFRGRMNELVARCQVSESKATTFISECAVLKARLEDAVQSQKISENQAAKLSEELAATVQSYDTQLSVMSEHLANMNEKLALQKDTIDHLKFQNVQSKGSKKGKQK